MGENAEEIKRNLDLNKSASLQGAFKLGTVTPTFFLLNQQNQLQFSSTDFSIMIEKIYMELSLVSESIKQNTSNYITTEISALGQKPLLVYFAMEGCSDCIAANDTIDDKEIQDSYDIVKIYRDNDPNDGRLLDNYQMFKTVFDGILRLHCNCSCV